MSKPIAFMAAAAIFFGGSGMAETIQEKLPAPQQAAGASLFDVLKQRRSKREFLSRALSRIAAAQLLWATQGITSPQGLRTAPSAGALYPLSIYLLAGNVEGLKAGIYRYDPQNHALTSQRMGDLRGALANAANDQMWIAQAPAAVVISADYTRTTTKYAERGIRYVHMEAGHAAQNLLLQAEEMGLSSVVVGAFDDAKVKSLLNLAGEQTPLSILPIGYPAR